MKDVIPTKKQKFIWGSKNIDLKNPKVIFITGASSGIGASLANYYARPGTTLILWGRSSDKLTKVKISCQQKGAIVATREVDLVNTDQALLDLESYLSVHQFDIAILAAGSGDIKNDHEKLESIDTFKKLAMLNYVTPCAMANRIAMQMIEKKSGHIVLIGSVAAFHSLPFATAYSSSKAGLTRFADCLRLALKRYGVKVTLITPGFVDTPMSQRLDCSKPFLMSVSKAVKKISAAINHNKDHVIMPLPFSILKWIDNHAPKRIRDYILLNLKVKQDHPKD